MDEKFSLDLNDNLLKEIIQALKEIGGWGSLEVYIQNFKVTQITKRAIRKTDHDLESGVGGVK